MKAKSKLNNVFEYFKYLILALSPILYMNYGFWIFDLATLLLLMIMVADILIRRCKFEINAKLLIVLVILMVINIISGLLHMDVIDIESCLNNSVTMLIVAVICAYFVKSSIAQADIFYKFIKAVSLISSIVLFVQYFLHTRGLDVTFYLPIVSKEMLESYPVASITHGRPNSLFFEPAFFCTYVLPVYYLTLRKRHYFSSVILLVAMYMSTSTTGVVSAIILTMMYIIKEKKIPVIIKWVIFMLGVSVIVMNISAITDVQIFEKMRFDNLKDNVRVFGTLKYFKYFNIVDVIFGVGINQLATFIKAYTSQDILNGANGLFFSFFSFGVIGGALLNKYFFDLHRLSKDKALFIAFAMIYVSAQILFSMHLVYMLLILYVFADKKEAVPELPDESSYLSRNMS